LLLDKPAGVTSHDVVSSVRRLLGTRAVGHTGTLDPFATGLLVVLVGRATRLARFVEGREKRYLAVARLGFATTTDDLTGEPVATGRTGDVRDADIAAALAAFVGRHSQRPPAYSAKHVAGVRSYRLARRGAAVELAPVDVEVAAIQMVARDGELVTFRATVSAGTYLRGIARDLGERLGTRAHLVALRREAIGDLSVDDAIPVAAVTPEALLSPLRMVSHLSVRALDDAEAGAVAHGRTIPGGAESGDVALVHGGELLAVGESGNGSIRPRVVLAG